MKFKTLLRPSLAVAFAFIGAFIARGGTPPEIFAVTGEYFLVAAALAFGVLGFILPDLLELATKASISAIARQIVIHLQSAPRDALFVANLPFSTIRRAPSVLTGRSTSRDKKYTNPMVVDTSVLIDGRILDIVRSGFVFGTFIVIGAVVSELHMLSDSADDLKRARGRRGLDVLASLKKEKNVKLEVLKVDPKADTTDDKLVKAAANLRGKLLTVDFNLNKVASVGGVTVLNINELANAVKTAVLPHEVLNIEINQIGKEKNQGVGYLEDGTMVVVEDGAKLKGKTVDVEVLRVFQTAAGKMIFGKLNPRI